MKGLVLGIVALIFVGLCTLSAWGAENRIYSPPGSLVLWEPLPPGCGPCPLLQGWHHLPDQPKSAHNAKKEQIAPKTSTAKHRSASAQGIEQPNRLDADQYDALLRSLVLWGPVLDDAGQPPPQPASIYLPGHHPTIRHHAKKPKTSKTPEPRGNAMQP